MAAVLLETGSVMAMAMASSSSRPSLQGGVVCSSQMVSGMSSPLRLTMSNGCSSSKRAVLPTCRGLKVVSVGSLGRRLPAAATVRASQQGSKGIVCESPETALGGPTGMVTDQTFQKLVLDSDVPVLVDFWAPWCGPCRMISPIIDELAKQYKGKLKCLKLNTDESPYIATEYGIRSIPTVMIFKRGEKKDTVIGAVPRSTLATTIEKYLD